MASTRDEGQSAFSPVYRIVARIPRGKVTSYGRIAAALARPLSPKAVGWAMSACPEGLPWHRVVSASGACVTESRGDLPEGIQRAMLESEGVTFDAKGRVDMAAFAWTPRKRRR